MNPHLDQLQKDHSTITEILRVHRAIPADGLQVGVRTLLGIYLHILEDALTTLDALIGFLSSQSHPSSS